MSTKLYIAGKMTGMPEFNFPAFHEAAAELRAAGYEVQNPAEGEHNRDLTKPWNFYMRHDIRMLLDCDGLALLEGWSGSKGAQLEYHIATAIEMPALPVEKWILSA